MTLVAFATYDDHAEFITDTAVYTHRLTDLVPDAGPKHHILTRYNAAVLSQGADVDFAHRVKLALDMAAEEAHTSSFDELLELASPIIAELWTDPRSAPAAGAEAAFFLIGRSESLGRYVALQYASEHEFEPQMILGAMAIPSPYPSAPSPLEMARIRGWHADRLDEPDVAEALDTWAARPPLFTPQSRADWRAIAQTIRRDRALDHFAHVAVAGRIIHGHLSTTGARIATIHKFDDTGTEFAQLVAGTQHPLALAADCECANGRTYGECCALDAPCGCRSGLPYGECCASADTRPTMTTGAHR